MTSVDAFIDYITTIFVELENGAVFANLCQFVFILSLLHIIRTQTAIYSLELRKHQATRNSFIYE